MKPPNLAPRITADDWGFSPGVNDGILELAQRGIVKNVAATVNMPYFDHRWSELLQAKDVEISLHLNFCFGPPLIAGSSLVDLKTGNFHSLSSFALRCVMGRVRADDLREEARAQIHFLQTKLPTPLKTLNGHRHCHLVPGVMKAILPVLCESKMERIRLPWDHHLWKTPKAPIMVLSALARRLSLPEGLGWEEAHYPLNKDFKNAERLKKKISSAHGKELLVHPAKTEDFAELNVNDPYKIGRRHEFEILSKLASEPL